MKNCEEQTVTENNDKWHPRYLEALEDITQEGSSPLGHQARVLRDVLGIPAGECAPVGAAGPLSEGQTPEQFVKGTQKERELWEKLTSFAGVNVEEVTESSSGTEMEAIISLDPRDGPLAKGAIPQELTDILQELCPDIIPILQAKLDERAHVLAEYGETTKEFETDRPIHLFRMPGGSMVVTVGYSHNSYYQKEHGKHFSKTTASADILAIEGYSDTPFGKSIWDYWKTPEGHYGSFMRSATAAGFSGLFTEVDPRDFREERVKMDNDISFLFFPKLPDDFFLALWAYYEAYDPALAGKIRHLGGLRQALWPQSTTIEGVLSRSRIIFCTGVLYSTHPYLTAEGETSWLPTGLELGEQLYSDAVSALRLQLIAQLQGQGLLPGSTIMDVQGAAHLPTKNFFLRYPEYAIEVILRHPHFSLVHLVDGIEGVDGVTKLLEEYQQNPERRKELLTEILWQLWEMPFHDVEDAPEKPIEPGKYELMQKFDDKLKRVREQSGKFPKKTISNIFRWAKMLGVNFMSQQRKLEFRWASYWTLQGMNRAHVEVIAEQMLEASNVSPFADLTQTTGKWIEEVLRTS